MSENFKFKNYYKSEPQLNSIDYTDSEEQILKAFYNISQTYARKHTRPGIDFEDLFQEAQMGILEAIKYYTNDNNVKKTYPFKQFVLYKIREKTYQYCLKNAIKIKTPYYIQRGSKHVAQIISLLQNSSTSYQLLQKENPEHSDIIAFLYNPNERLPLKTDEFIRAQINPNLTTEQFNQVYLNVINHKRGSAHSFVKKNLTDIGKILHIKEKIWYNATSNNMPFERVISLILEARASKTNPNVNLCSKPSTGSDNNIIMEELIVRGKKVCGEKEFNIFFASKYLNKTYTAISKQYQVPKNDITGIIKKCLKILKDDFIIKELGDN